MFTNENINSIFPLYDYVQVLSCKYDEALISYSLMSDI